jgi:hypothetical protein
MSMPAPVLSVTAIEAAFGGRLTIGAPAAARLLDMDIKTLQRHVAAGNLVGRLKGLGRTRRHRVFTRDDITRFLQTIAQEVPCPFIAPSAARTGNSISRSRVIAFPARPSASTNVTRRLSRKPKNAKPASSSSASPPQG